MYSLLFNTVINVAVVSVSSTIQQETKVLAEQLDKKKCSLEKQLLDMRHDLKSCAQQMDLLKVHISPDPVLHACMSVKH